MIEDYYICLDATALYFAHKYLADKTTLRTMQNKMLKAKIKNLEVLGAVFERADKG